MSSTISDSDVANHGGAFDLRGTWRNWWQQSPPYTVSMLLHMVLLLALALFGLSVQKDDKLVFQIVSVEEELADELQEVDLNMDPLEDMQDDIQPTEIEMPELTDIGSVEPIVEDAAPLANLDTTLLDNLFAGDLAADVSGSGLLGKEVGTMLRGRNPASRLQRALARGGSRKSEAAVDAALQWFARHQYPDGSWNFNHGTCPQCKGRCGDPGGNKATTGATGMVLLCYLGAGETHKKGKYRKTVHDGLMHLRKTQGADGSLAGGAIPQGDGAALMSHNPYCHGFAALALCEAYAMTHDERLKKPGQTAIDWIVRLQDPNGGGFRYRPGQRGDVSVTTLQIMTLKSASQTGLVVPKETFAGAVKFLDSCAGSYGGQYGYSGPTHDWVPGESYGGALAIHSTTALGLLSRIYTGWPRSHPNMQRGVQHLVSLGPAEKDNYFNYYATLVLHHYGGREWKAWNAKMRDFLVARQSKAGHEVGSWAPFGAWQTYGGRLMDTAFACMTLEVYYRYMPIYNSHVPD